MAPSGPLSCALRNDVRGSQTIDEAPCGFSLTELVLVLAIIATLALVAAPRFANATARYRVDLAAGRIVADLALAKSLAKSSSSTRTVAFNVATDSYQILDGEGVPVVAVTAATEAAGTTVRLDQPPYNATITSAAFSADAEVVFDGYGVPDSGGTVVVRVGAYQRIVTLDPDTGKGSVQ